MANDKQKKDGKKPKQAAVAVVKHVANKTAVNKARRIAKDAKVKDAHKAHPHDAERQRLREQWRKEARKTSKDGWVPSFAVWRRMKECGDSVAAQEKRIAAALKDLTVTPTQGSLTGRLPRSDPQPQRLSPSNEDVAFESGL